MIYYLYIALRKENGSCLRICADRSNIFLPERKQTMNIEAIKKNKKQFLDLLLLADEQESMIDRYLDRGTMFALSDGGSVRAVCVVTEEGNGVCELKNIAVSPSFQGMGYGKRLIDHICGYFKTDCHTMLVGTGDSPLTIPFYEACGFHISHRIKNFFTDNYDHPIFEAGKQLVDMVYLKKELRVS